MLGQSMAFYADEFAGRITTKIMQTALAVRDMIFTTTDVVIGMGIYLVTILVLLAGFDARLLLPFAAWMLAYGLACWYFVPRLGQVGKLAARARASPRWSTCCCAFTTCKAGASPSTARTFAA